MASRPGLNHWPTICTLCGAERAKVINVSADLKMTAMCRLRLMGITAATLFPGLEGVALDTTDYLKIWHSGRT